MEIKTAEDKFKKNMKQKYETKKVDKPVLKKSTMKNITKGVLQVPEMLHMVSSPDKPSAKPAKPEENKLQTGPGKDFSKSTMNNSQSHRG